VAVAGAPTRRARVLRKRTRPRRPQRIQRQHDPLFENSQTTSPTGPAEPDSGQLPRNCDIMAVRGRVHLHPRPRKRRTCPHVSFLTPLIAPANRAIHASPSLSLFGRVKCIRLMLCLSFYECRGIYPGEQMILTPFLEKSSLTEPQCGLQIICSPQNTQKQTCF